MPTRKYFIFTLLLLFFLLSSVLSAQQTAFRKGVIADEVSPLITNERVITVPFKEGVLIFNGESSGTFIYYFDGEQPPVLIGESEAYTVDLGPLPGGRLISSSNFGDRVLQFISEEDFSMTTLDHPYGRSLPKNVVFPDFILQFETLGSELVITRVGGQPVRSEEVFRTAAINAFNNIPSYKVHAGRVIISTLSRSFITDGTAGGTLSLPNHIGRSPHSVHFFNGEYYFWDEIVTTRGEIVALDPITGMVRRVMGLGFPSALKPVTITDMTVTPAGIVYVASTSEYGYGLFLTDGTIEGSRLLREFPEIYGFWGIPRSLWRNAPHPNGAIAFLVEGASGDFDELWQSDGTDAGTKKIRDLPPGLTSFNLGGVARYDTMYSYFYATLTYETGILKQLYGANLEEEEFIFQQLEADSFAIHTASSYIANEDWFLYTNTSDATVGMRAYNLEEDIRILYPNSPRASNTNPIFIGDQAYVPVQSSEAGEEPGVITLGGELITILADVFPGATGSKPSFFTIGDSIFFLANNPDSGYGIYRTNGTSDGTSFYGDLHNRNDIRSLGRIQKVGNEVLAARLVEFNFRLNQGIDSVEAIPPPYGALSNESVGGFIAHYSTAEGRITFSSLSDNFSKDEIFPNITGVTKPIAFGEEFVFLMTENGTEWSLAFVNPLSQAGRQFPLDTSLNVDWTSNGMFMLEDELFFLLVEGDGNKTFFKYSIENGLQRSDASFLPEENIRTIVRGLRQDNILIRTYIPDVGIRNTIYDRSTDSFISGLQASDHSVSSFITQPDKLIVMTIKQLYLSISETNIAPAQGGILVDETNSEFNLKGLTYILDGTMLFMKTKTSTTELWRTDGTSLGTRKLVDFDGGSSLIRWGRPIPYISGWLIFTISYETNTSHVLYNYETGAVLKIANSNAISDAIGVGNRFYFIGKTDRDAKKMYFLERIERQGDIGIVYEDENRNGLKEPEERGLSGSKVRFQFPSEEIVTFSSEEGEYPRFYSQEETYEVIIEPDVCWEVTTDSIVRLNDTINTPDFGLNRRSDFYDLKTSIFSGPLRCGFEVPFWVVITNSGCQDLTDITVAFMLDAEATFISASLPPDEILEEKLNWGNINLSAGETWRANLLITMPDETRTGTVVPFSLMANGLTSVEVAVADSFAYLQILRCAIDPNDKLVSPARPEESNSNYTQVDETLTYTIRFQNTGNDTALNVRLEDQLAATLDLSTFKPVAASHSYRVLLAETGRLEVYFDDISLPDSNINEMASHGFFAFEIALKEEGLNTSIENTAGIFFDFNAPIITNTVSNSIVEFLDEDQDEFYFWEECDDQNRNINPAAHDIGGNGIDEDCDGEDWTTATENPLPGELSLFPSPTKGLLQVEYNLSGNLQAEIFDARGRRIQGDFFKGSIQFDLSQLPAAIYLLKFTEPVTGQFTFRRIIKF